MKVFYSSYHLKSIDLKVKHLSHEGLLLAFEDKDKTSYSLYQPIESLGDKSIAYFTKNFESLVLNNGPMSRVFDLSVDEEKTPDLNVACYRQCRGVSEAEDSLEGTVKIKVNSLRDTIDELKRGSEKKYILDANAQWSLKDLKLLEEKNLHEIIKYIEDPVTEIDFESSFSIASDFIDYKAYNYKVLKPTGFNHSLENKLKAPLVITSYLDHPLGQIISAQYAKKENVTESCGLMSHNLFEPSDYSNLLSKSGSFVFSNYSDLFSLLQKEKWRRLL